jgi:hypothetical protein
MADNDRDKLMRLAGMLVAASNMIEQINVPPEERRVRDLVETANNALRKAMLAAWESADEKHR